jgi:hypothetical protein
VRSFRFMRVVSGAKLVRFVRNRNLDSGRMKRSASCRFRLSDLLTLNQRVPGSSPGAPTIAKPLPLSGFFYFEPLGSSEARFRRGTDLAPLGCSPR